MDLFIELGAEIEDLDFEELIRVKYDLVVYSKNNVEYAFQAVDNLGVLIEYENTEDFGDI